MLAHLGADQRPESAAAAPWALADAADPDAIDRGTRSTRNGSESGWGSASGSGSAVSSGTPEGARGFYLVAVMCLGVSVDTAWRFFEHKLGITNLVERALMFSVLEVALVACGFGMRASVRRSGRPGPARVLAWGLCGLAGYMALVLSGPVTGLARVALGPVLGLVTLHHALGIELRAAGHDRAGSWARIGRELRERALSRLGLGDDGRDAAARIRDRAARRVARLCTARLVLARRPRLCRLIHKAGVAHDPAARARMLAELAALQHAAALIDLDQPSPWHPDPAASRPAHPSTVGSGVGSSPGSTGGSGRAAGAGSGRRSTGDGVRRSRRAGRAVVPRSIEQLRTELAAELAAGSVQPGSAESIRRALRCSPARARQLRDEHTNQAPPRPAAAARGAVTVTST